MKNQVNKKCNHNNSYISRDLFENSVLRQVIEHSYDGIMVTDNRGTVLIANPASVRLMQKVEEEVIGYNVQDLVRKGYYNTSTTMEAIQKRKAVTRLVKLPSGVKLMSTSIPLIDEKNEIVMVITNTRDKDLVDTYIAALEQERDKSEHYKNVVNYLEELGSQSKAPIAESKMMNEIIQTAGLIAKTDSTVLLLGETGTGKEVMARYIHKNSLRLKEPFIPVNCAAIPNELMESEFFGYERGAFSGAKLQGKPGFFEIANKGTLFLDEVGELPMSMQSKLLRVLETGEVQRLGGTSFKNTNVRLIAATNKDLKHMISQNLFREDLYYRLNVIPIKIPPLRERPEDIVVLAEKFLEEYNQKYSFNKVFSDTTLRGFINYKWPGNARELRNLVERLAIITPDNIIEYEDKSDEGSKENGKAHAPANMPDKEFEGTLKDVIKTVEEEYINSVLKACNGRIGDAAKRLGIHRTMLYRKMNAFKQHVE